MTPFDLVIFITLIMMVWEHKRPQTFFQRTQQSYLNNFLLYLIGLFLLFASTRWFTMSDVLAGPTAGDNVYSNLLIWLTWCAQFLLIDFIFYCKHRVDHRVGLLWRLHLVHHSDTDVDLSTGFRHHPLEVVVSYGIVLGIAYLLGIPFSVMVVYATVSSIMQPLQHANVALPAWLMRYLSVVLITPDLHKVHHSDDARYTDSNFGNVFSFWDRIFRTYQADKGDSQYGLKYFREGEEGRLTQMLSQPFRYLRRHTQ